MTFNKLLISTKINIHKQVTTMSTMKKFSLLLKNALKNVTDYSQSDILNVAIHFILTLSGDAEIFREKIEENMLTYKCE